MNKNEEYVNEKMIEKITRHISTEKLINELLARNALYDMLDVVSPNVIAKYLVACNYRVYAPFDGECLI